MIPVADNVSSPPHPPGTAEMKFYDLFWAKKRLCLSLLGGDGEYFMQEAVNDDYRRNISQCHQALV